MGVLNFDTNKLITGVNIIDGNLYWTDDNSEPKKLEIDQFRDYDHTGTGTTIRGEYVIESDLSVIRLHPWKGMDLEITAYTPTATQPEPPFEAIFPRFSYRWKYEDGQLSPYAPFTQAAFIPAARTADTGEENYTEGFNTTLFNNVGTITLNNIPRGPRDVVAVQILYTESIASTVYILEEIEIPEAQRGLDFVLSSEYSSGEPQVPGDYSLLPLSYQLSARKAYRAINDDQLARPYDEVPQRALAQEITANRLVYGNYQIGFDQDNNVELDAEFISAGTGDGLHVKGNRTYEVGVQYIDPYGRQGALLQAGSITLDDGSVQEQIPLQSAFNQATRQQIEVTITSDPPTWADRYRYYIKDPSMDHHNLISYNIYNDGGISDTDSEFVWVEFQSTDRNKVFDESSAADGQSATVLVLRRVNDNVQSTKQRFLVQDIENEAPTDVREQVSQTVTNIQLQRQGSAGDNVDGLSTGGTTLIFNAGGTGTATVNQFQNGLINQVNTFTRSFRPEDGTDTEFPTFTLNRMLANVQANGIDASLLTQQIYIRLRQGTTFVGGEDSYVEVLSFGNDTANGVSANDRRNHFGFTLGRRFTFTEEEGLQETGSDGVGGALRDGQNYTIEFYVPDATDTAIERLGGRFWVRTARNGLETLQSEFTFEGELVNLQQIWFETEPAVDASNLDLFWESSDTYCVCTQHGWPNQIDWYNCLAEVDAGGVYLESTRINDKFNSVQVVKGVRATIPSATNAIQERPYGMIYSGIYNSRTGINNLNEFATAAGITKELEPNYGSIQKLYTRDTNIIAFTEDKIFKILADKDQLFNADGGGNVSASNAVLGQTTPFNGEYGISQNPESFAYYGHNLYCTDAKRGVVLQITPGNGQIFEISGKGLTDFFRDRLFSSDRIWGMFDDYTDKYVVSMQGYDQNDPMIDDSARLPNETDEVTLGYELGTEAWTSRMSFIPEAGAALNNKFYTWNDGQLYMHNSSAVNYNNFYGTGYNTEVEVIFNDSPSEVLEFLTLGYEGDDNWEVVSIETDQDTAALLGDFVRREGKYFQAIVSTEPIYTHNAADPANPTDTGETQLKGGAKGFYCKVRFRSTSESSAELFSINSEVIKSSI